MEELWELKKLILNRDYNGALALVEELEEMSKKDIINNIRSYAVILLLHIVKQTVENRTTRSWDDSIKYSRLEIQALNRRRKSKGNYLDEEDLEELLQDAFKLAIIKARQEMLEGVLSSEQIAELVDKDDTIRRALNLILEAE